MAAPKSHPHWTTRDEQQEMIDLYLSGLSLAQVGEKVGRDLHTVQRVLKIHDVPRRGNGRRGATNARWKGGRRLSGDGYVVVDLPDDSPFVCMRPNVKGHYWVKEHRLIVAQHLGRPLRSDESVHHIDGNRQNNDINNLQLRSSYHGAGQAWICGACGSTDVQPTALAGEHDA